MLTTHTRPFRFCHSLALLLLLVLLIPAPVQAETRFENVYPFPEKKFMQVMKWRWTRRPAQWPKTRPVTSTPRTGRALSGQQAAVTWIGHASFLVEFENMRVLLDPIYSETTGPADWLGVKRVVAPGLTLEQTPKVDIILLSHNHFDHMDLPTLEFFAKRDNPIVIAGVGNKPLLEDVGFSQVVEMNRWDTHTVRNSLNVTFVPAQHWSTRSLFSRNTTLWGGFYFKFKEKTFYFVGDTGYHSTLFKEIRARVGSPDFAFIPIGAYEPRDFMRDQHVNPAEAVDVHQDVQSKHSVGMHWGTFQLSDEGIDEPCDALNRDSKEKGLGSLDFTCMSVGETRLLFADGLQAGQ